MKNKNPYIKELKDKYDESMRLIDQHIDELIKADADMTAIIQFSNYIRNIHEIRDISENLYSLIYKSKKILKHFGSSKINLRTIPLTSFFKANSYANPEDVDRYTEELKKHMERFYNDNGNFERDEFNDFFVRIMLAEEGYIREHWYFKSSFISEIEFMLDFLLKFVEEDFIPINNNIQYSKNNQNSIPKSVEVAVWRRDLGKCAKCGSSDMLRYEYIIPIEKGGSNALENVRLLCEICSIKYIIKD